MSKKTPIPAGLKACSAQIRRRTPPAFAEWLLSLAAQARRTRAAWSMVHGDARTVLADLHLEVENSVVVTDPVWPNAPAGMFPGVEDPAALLAEVAAHFPRLARRVVVQLGVASDPRFLVAVPPPLRFVRTCWLRYGCPSYSGTVLNSGDVAYVFGSHEGPMGKVVLPGEVTDNLATPRDARHPCPRKLGHVLWLIENFTRPGDIVLDPFAGSGTTGAACIRRGRRFLGVERDAAHFAEAVERLTAEEHGSTLAHHHRGQEALFR